MNLEYEKNRRKDQSKRVEMTRIFLPNFYMMYSELLLYHFLDRIRNNREEIRWGKGVNAPTPSQIPVMASDLLGVPRHQPVTAL